MLRLLFESAASIVQPCLQSPLLLPVTSRDARHAHNRAMDPIALREGVRTSLLNRNQSDGQVACYLANSICFGL